MDDLEQEDINEELFEFAILESIQEAYKLQRSGSADRYGKSNYAWKSLLLMKVFLSNTCWSKIVFVHQETTKQWKL